jgi:hypothetical protein
MINASMCADSADAVSIQPGDLVRLISTKDVVSIGILMKINNVFLSTSWEVLLPEGVYSHVREEGWRIELLSR